MGQVRFLYNIEYQLKILVINYFINRIRENLWQVI